MSRDLEKQRELDPSVKAGADVDVDAEHKPETARRSSNAGLRREAAQVQRKGTAEGDKENIHALAEQGVAGAGEKLPHHDKIQASFGQHDVSQVKAHQAPGAAKAMGAEAYATGNNVAFGGTPDLHTAAHEAAHVVQQKQGVQLKGGVGKAGDSHEKNADAVADRVVAGESAEDLLGPVTNNAAPAQGVQMKEATEKEKAAEADTAELKTSQALTASMHLTTAQLNAAAIEIKKILKSSTDAGPELKLTAVEEVFTKTMSQADHLGIVAADMSAMLSAQTYKDGRKGDVAALRGAFDNFKDAFSEAEKLAKSTPGATLTKNPYFIQTALDPAFKIFGDVYKASGSDRSGSSDVKAETSSALDDHAAGALEAARALHMGVPNESARFKLHVKEVKRLLNESDKKERNKHRATVKAVVTEVRALETDRPGLIPILKDVQPIVEELDKLFP